MNDPEVPHNDSNKLGYEAPDEERPSTSAPTEAQLETELPTVKTLDYSPAPAAHDPYAAFRLKAFQQYIVSFLLATLGTQITIVALQWELAKRTGDPKALAWLGLIEGLPVILLALPAGHVSDTFSRKRVLMVTQLFLVLCPALLALLLFVAGDHPHLIEMGICVVLIDAIALTFARPARQSFLPQIVNGNVFANAITWNSTTFELASVTGPFIGAMIIWISNTQTALIVSSMCTLGCWFMTSLLPSIPPPQKRDPLNFRSLVAGVRFVFRHEFLLPAMTLDLFAVLVGGVTYMLPFFAQRLGVGELGFGVLKAAPALGAITMATILAHSPPLKKAGRAMLLSVVAFGLATIIFGLSTNFWLSLSMLFATGAADNISVVVRHTLVQLMTPDEMRGRVSAVNQVFIGSSNYLGGTESGFAAELLGLVRSVVLGGIGTILVVGAISLRWPKLRKFGALQQPHA